MVSFRSFKKRTCFLAALVLLSIAETCCEHYQISQINGDLCQLQFLSSKISKITCILKCRNKEKVATYKNEKCYCAEEKCLEKHKQQKDWQSSNLEENDDTVYQLFAPKQKCFASDFVIEFLQPATNVPVHPNKEIFIKDEITFTVWFYTNVTVDSSVGYNYRTFFTMPRDFSAQNSRIQCFIQVQQIITFGFKNKAVIATHPDAFQLGKWNHLVVTCHQVTATSTNVIFYVNGEMIFQKIIVGTFNELPIGEPYRGFVLGNDVDEDKIDDPTQYFPGKLSKLYIYNTILSKDQIQGLYNGKYPTKNQVVFWDEFRGMAQETQTQIECQNSEIRERTKMI